MMEMEHLDPEASPLAEALRQRLGALNRRQISAWRAMTPARRLEIALCFFEICQVLKT